jgi:hypothetical protein
MGFWVGHPSRTDLAGVGELRNNPIRSGAVQHGVSVWRKGNREELVAPKRGLIELPQRIRVLPGLTSILFPFGRQPVRLWGGLLTIPSYALCRGGNDCGDSSRWTMSLHLRGLNLRRTLSGRSCCPRIRMKMAGATQSCLDHVSSGRKSTLDCTTLFGDVCGSTLFSSSGTCRVQADHPPEPSRVGVRPQICPRRVNGGSTTMMCR